MKRDTPAGLPLTAQPPLYQFTNSGHSIAWSNCAVHLFDHHGRPHWFATDGYSAMLTPALLPGSEEGLFPLQIGERRVYLPDHIKSLFRYVKGKHVLYEVATGTLLSPDGIVHVPPFEHQVEEGEEPEAVPMPDLTEAFAGEPVEQSTVSLGLKFIAAIRSAFSHTTKEAGIEMTYLENDRIHLAIGEPYEAQVLISMNAEAPLHEEEPEDAQTPAGQLGEQLAALPGVESVTLSSGGQSVTLTADTAKKARKPRRKAEAEARP